jgi:E-phenylitaconyl-CoA hydratase
VLSLVQETVGISIDLEIDAGGIATLTINRPGRMNALDTEHYRDLSRAWIEVRDNPVVSCAIVTGAGEIAFCAGADIKEQIGRKTALGELWQAQQSPLLNRGLEIWKPVIAAVNGYCLGGGITLLLATDICVAVPGAEFGMAEVKRGVIAGLGGTQRILRQLPHAIAMEFLLTGDRINAAAAERWGLVNKVVAIADLMATARAYATRIAGNAPLAVQAAKELARRSRDASLEDGMRLEQMISHILQTSEDVQEGRAAFMEKRKPEFRGK